MYLDHAQNSPKDTTDINEHVTDKTNMDGRVLEDQQITTYGIRYSSILSIDYSSTFTWFLCDFKAFFT